MRDFGWEERKSDSQTALGKGTLMTVVGTTMAFQRCPQSNPQNL